MGQFIGEHEPKRGNYRERCPDCGGIKSKRAITCVVCRPVKQVERDAEAMDRHRRWSAALEAGWTEGELIHMRPNIPTWEQILARNPQVIIERWFRCPD
jgi:hypothetical protein